MSEVGSKKWKVAACCAKSPRDARGQARLRIPLFHHSPIPHLHRSILPLCVPAALREVFSVGCAKSEDGKDSSSMGGKLQPMCRFGKIVWSK